LLAASVTVSIVASGASSVESPSGSLLDRRFPDTDVSFLLLDARTGQAIASRWEDVDQPVPLGSLVKPFAALAYGAGHSFRYPTFKCSRASGCWYPPGHGSMNLSQALAHSCNHYFRQLSAQVKAGDLANVTARLGLPSPRHASGPDAYWGLGEDWRIEPAAMLHAYVALSRSPAVPGSAPILQGLALSARQGTAKGIGNGLRQAPALAKTGTGPCLHRPNAGGDGFVVALYPVDQPRYALLVRAHGQTGRRAAEIGGAMLRVLIEGE
jgi:cell division protein FtsI/penicillin-binding protein 2